MTDDPDAHRAEKFDELRAETVRLRAALENALNLAAWFRNTSGSLPGDMIPTDERYRRELNDMIAAAALDGEQS